MRGSSAGPLILGALVVLTSASFTRAAQATGCEAELPPKLGEAETKRLQKRLLEGVPETDRSRYEEPTELYAADIDNDGRPDIVGESFEGSAGFLVLQIFAERNGKIVGLPDPPAPKGLTAPPRDGEPWYVRGPGPLFMLKLCDRTIIAVPGFYAGAMDGFMWKGGKTTRVCDPDWTAYQTSLFKQEYDKKAFEPANGILKSYLETCGARLPSETRLSILSNLAITAFHLGANADCLGYVAQAKKVSGFDGSKSKAALLFNEASCAKSPVNAPKYAWLLDPKKLPPNEKEHDAYEGLLLATVPMFNFETKDLAVTIDKWLADGAHGRGRTVTDGRYVTIWGCNPEDCEDRSMVWVDVQTGTSAVATNSLQGCFAVGSFTFGPSDLPAAFKKAFADWMKTEKTGRRRCTSFIDGRKSLVTRMKME